MDWALESSKSGGLLCADGHPVGSVWDLATDKEGTRLLQDLLKFADADGARMLAYELKEKVNEAWSGSHARYASHVVEHCIQHLPVNQSGFIVQELLLGYQSEAAADKRTRNVIEAACSRYGCRIIQRLIEHPPDPDFMTLRAHLLSNQVLACMLSPQHPTLGHDKAENFGHFVVQRLLENPPDHECTKKIQDFLAGLEEEDMLIHINDKHLSWVWGKAMQHDTMDRGNLVTRVLELAHQRPEIKKQKYSSFVFKEAQRLVKKPDRAAAPGKPDGVPKQGGLGNSAGLRIFTGEVPGKAELVKSGMEATSVSQQQAAPQPLGGPMLACVFLPTPQLAHAVPRLLHAVAHERVFFTTGHGIPGAVMALRMP